ncbi:MAG: FliI/YscN family ATPase [Pseudoruegeria sp.]
MVRIQTPKATPDPDGVHISSLISRLSHATKTVRSAQLYGEIGWINSIRGAIVRASLSNTKVGQICEIRDPDKMRLAEVVGFEGDNALLGPFGDIQGLKKKTLVVPISDSILVPVGTALMGRVIGPLGDPIDGLAPLKNTTDVPVYGTKIYAMDRPLISEPLVTGVKAVDSAIMMGKGQRIGIFGPPGVGKSNLLSALARNGQADVIVIGLVGERAREVREFLDRHLPKEERDKIVCVVSTSESPPMERLYAAHTANRVAEYFRDEGKSVLLLIDSLTRVARALREIGLSAGEPPSRRGYPASVYAALPAIIERAGKTEKGAITALYTVLTEGEIQEDPIAEEVRSLTDGHIILSRELAERNQYPAIDVLSSISRLMADIASEKHIEMAQRMRRLLSRYAEVELLIQIGEYQPGTDAELDQAVSCYDEFQLLLRQTPKEISSLEETLDHMNAILE